MQWTRRNRIRQQDTTIKSRGGLITLLLVFNLSSISAQAEPPHTGHAMHFAPVEHKRHIVKPDKKSSPAPAKTLENIDSMSGMDHSGMNHNSMPPIDQVSKPDTPQDSRHSMNHGNHASEKAASMNNGNHNNHDEAGHGPMPLQDSTSPSDLRDPHAYSDGYDFGPLPQPQMGNEDNHGSLLADRLESQTGRNDTSVTYDWQAWYGQTYNRLLIRAEGEIESGTFKNARNELLWAHAATAYWDTHLDVRYDSGKGTDRGWLALGIQGLAPALLALCRSNSLCKRARAYLIPS